MVFVAPLPALAKATLNCRLALIMSELPEVWIDDPALERVHWELETLPVWPGVT
jgi:hypothetical protein